MSSKGGEPAAQGSPEGCVIRVEAEDGVAAGVTLAGVVATLRADQEPPDVIEVVFPAARSGSVPPIRTVGSSRSAAGSAAESFTVPPHGSRLQLLRERPLLLGGVAIAVVALAAVLAWQAWPQTPTTARPGPAPAPAATQPPLAEGLLPPISRTPSAGSTPALSPSAAPFPSGTGTAPAATAAPLAAPARTPTTAGATPSGTPSASGSSPAAPRTLSSGDSGSDVTALQQVLFDQGFTYVSTTGVYDDATVRGVTQAQQDRGLTCDPVGVYGPCTRAALPS